MRINREVQKKKFENLYSQIDKSALFEKSHRVKARDCQGFRRKNYLRTTGFLILFR